MSQQPFFLRSRVAENGDVSLLSPSVGIFTPSLSKGALLGAGQSIGTIEVLGARRELLVPESVAGRVVRRIGGSLARVPVQFGDELVSLSTASVADVTTPAAGRAHDAGGALSFDAPMSGRFYGRPSPAEPSFIEPGDVVSHGQTVGLLEVMKTFNRLVYQCDGLPQRATVVRIVPSDGDDVVRGDPILVLAEARDG